MFIGLLHRTTKYVIPRRGEAPTWESPGTMFVSALLFDLLYQEIATGLTALAMTNLIHFALCILHSAFRATAR